MKKRTLRRRVIIREYDFKKIKSQALGLYMDQYSLYDRVSWTPLDKDNLEKIQLAEILKGKNNPLTETQMNLKSPASLLAKLKDYLYDQNYYNWTVTVDEEGYICVQARKNTPKTRIGWGIFEKDLESRL